MKLLVVSQYFYPENFRINEVVTSLVERGIQVDVLTGKPNYPEGIISSGYCWWDCCKETFKGATIFRVPIIPRFKGSAINLTLNYLSYVMSATIFGAWMLRRRQYDLIFVYAPSPILQAIPAIFISILKRCGVVLWVQDLWPDSLVATGYIKRAWLLNFVGSIVAWIYRKVDLILVQSSAFIQKIQEIAPSKKIIYYPNSVDPSFSQNSETILTLPDEIKWSNGFNILFAGNLGKAQALEVILDAAQLLLHIPQIRFFILGNGSRWEWMCQEVKVKEIVNVRMLGRFSPEMMPRFMQKADALLVTLADQEVLGYTVPNKVQAYLASGRPIIACLNGEGANIVEEAVAGVTAVAGDANGLVKGIIKLFNMSEEERLLLGENGKRYFMQNFEHEQLVDKLVEHLKLELNP